jgi:methionine aminotransferase
MHSSPLRPLSNDHSPMPPIESKLPHVGTTIFTTMSQRAKELGAINLAQGFPDYDPPQRLKELLAAQALTSSHQYAPMTGLQTLREQISARYAAAYGVTYDADAEITITLGATEALFSAVQALVGIGDEVILFDPSYDSYGPAVLLAGAKPIHIPLLPPSFSIDWQRVADALSPRTRMIIINSPHNPTGTVMTSADLDTLAALIRDRNVAVLSDEVYEHMVFDGGSHASVCGHAELRERSVGVFSFGKPLHATGWRVGYALAPRALTGELRKVHQFNTFSIANPLQMAISAFMDAEPLHSQRLAAFYQAKRDYFLRALQSSRFTWQPSRGTFFQSVDFSAIAQTTDVEFAERLLVEVGVAAIPVSVFYAEPIRLSIVRLCFAKRETTLDKAAQRLCRM